MAKDHYIEHVNQWYFDASVDSITSRPLIAMVLEGNHANKIIAKMKGLNVPLKVEPGTIRGDFSTHWASNVIHSSDSVEAANREINIWFKGDEVIPIDVEH